MWIHGRTRGSAYTSVQIEHSVISISFSAVNMRAMTLLVSSIPVSLFQCSESGNIAENESESDAAADKTAFKTRVE